MPGAEPERHLVHLDRCRMQDGPFEVMTRFLRNLLDLAFDFLRWCKTVNEEPFFKPGEREAFEAAEKCEACGERFSSSVGKVLHHRHGTGEYLAPLCSGCNAAFKRRKLIPIYFHNGGGCDFHFLVRTIAHLTQVQATSADEEDESGDDSAGDEEPENVLDEREAELEYVDFRRLKFEVLVKSGERFLQVRLGPLLFLDSCNIFPASLDALIKDLASTESDPAKAFPLLAERHPLFKDAEPRVWQLLLKKIPMPFEKLAGPECWSMPALMPDKSYYDSRLSGLKRSDAKYEEIREIIDYFAFESFAEFHDAYLHTDIGAC